MSKTVSKTVSKNKKDNPNDYPPLGRAFHKLSGEGVGRVALWGFIALCAALLIWNFLHPLHGKFHAETVFGFYAAFGFVAFATVIFGAKTLRYFLERREDYYGISSIDSEPDLPAHSGQKPAKKQESADV